MSKHSKITEEKKNDGTGCVIIFFIIFLIIFVPILIGLVSNNIEKLKQTNHEAKLIEDGKVKTHNEVINEIVDIFKNKNKEKDKLKGYLATDFIYYDNENMEHKYISSFFEDLKIYSSSYEVERRGDTSSSDWATYKIYWNVVEENKKKGINKNNQYYCLQTVTIMLRKVIKENEITYEIDKIILKDR